MSTTVDWSQFPWHDTRLWSAKIDIYILQHKTSYIYLIRVTYSCDVLNFMKFVYYGHFL